MLNIIKKTAFQFKELGHCWLCGELKMKITTGLFHSTHFELSYNKNTGVLFQCPSKPQQCDDMNKPGILKLNTDVHLII